MGEMKKEQYNRKNYNIKEIFGGKHSNMRNCRKISILSKYNL